MNQEPTLSERVKVDIHFYDIDSLNIVWHGNYLKYLENSREAFGLKYGIEYMDIFNNGYIAPIVDLRIRYLNMMKLGERLIVEAAYIPSRAAKFVLDYTVYRESDMAVAATASTTQLFMTRDGIFEPSVPDFFREWRKKWGV